jgi:HemN C-terminal domain
LRRHVIQRLMCDLAVDLDAAAQRYGFRSSVFEPEEQALRQLETEGLVTIEGRKIALTSEGRPLDAHRGRDIRYLSEQQPDARSSVPRQSRRPQDRKPSSALFTRMMPGACMSRCR